VLRRMLPGMVQGLFWSPDLARNLPRDRWLGAQIPREFYSSDPIKFEERPKTHIQLLAKESMGPR
jgi:hypothetical protein